MTMTFDEAVQALLGAPKDAVVTSEFSEASTFQIGDYTWDSDPGGLDVVAEWKSAGERKVASLTFSSLPELFAALREAEEKASRETT